MERMNMLKDLKWEADKIERQLLYIMMLIDDTSCKQAEKDLLKYEIQKIIGEQNEGVQNDNYDFKFVGFSCIPYCRCIFWR